MFIQRKTEAERLQALFRFAVAVVSLTSFAIFVGTLYVAAHFIVKFW